jgi:hypothetical protein
VGRKTLAERLAVLGDRGDEIVDRARRTLALTGARRPQGACERRREDTG